MDLVRSVDAVSVNLCSLGNNMRNLIVEELSFVVGGNGPQTGSAGGTVRAGDGSASCPAGTIPVAGNANLNFNMGGFSVGGSGSFGFCYPG